MIFGYFVTYNYCVFSDFIHKLLTYYGFVLRYKNKMSVSKSVHFDTLLFCFIIKKLVSPYSPIKC